MSLSTLAIPNQAVLFRHSLENILQNILQSEVITSTI